MMPRSLITLGMLAGMLVTAASAADSTDLTVYRSDNDSLFSAADRGSLEAGYAMVHERRDLTLTSGNQVVNLDGLPAQLDTEALDLDFGERHDVRTLASRLLLPDQASLLGTHVGEHVGVYGDSGQLLAQGTLLGIRDGLLIDDAQGGATLVRDYASVHLGHADVRGGARLQVTVHAGSAGPAHARLVYPTGGLGWRAAYAALLDEDHGGCHVRFDSDASIANRSGRDWQATTLKLVAGEPQFAKSSGPNPRMMRASFAKAAPAPESTPQQASMGDYRSYTVDGSVDLPDGSITRVPLYDRHDLDCTHQRVFEHGASWQPPHPQLAREFDRGGDETVTSNLTFKAFDNLPAGYLRVSGLFDGRPELLGEARIADTPKGRSVDVTLGNAFELRGQRERTSFSLDKAARTLDEAFRVTLTNGGDQAREVTVREHPNRWRNWERVSSSVQPVKSTPDTLVFRVPVPAGGRAVIDYALRYHWTANDE